MDSRQTCRRCGVTEIELDETACCPSCRTELDPDFDPYATRTDFDANTQPDTLATNPATLVRYVGDYELLGVIAQGGMGVVYRARQVSLHRVVALKMILSAGLADDEQVTRFLTEAEAVANLDHPHIVPIYEVGRHEGQHYFTMKLLTGGSLSTRMADLSSRPRDASRLMATVARAVHFAHRSGILHRDLKPANILLDDAGSPHVADFGLAKKIESDAGITHSGAIMGTPSYMAPEQAAGRTRNLTTAVDIYSLGAILYEILAGRTPFVGGSILELLRKVVEDEPVRPGTLSPGVDRDLETIALKCLEKDPSRRYGSAEALADDLDRWLVGEPILARPSSTFEKAMKWARRRPAIAALAGSIVGVALVGLAGIFWQWRAAEANAVTARNEERKANAATRAALDSEAATRKANEKLQEALRIARFNSYASHIAYAQREWADGNVDQARALLEVDDEAEFRGFEWRHLHRLYHAETLVLEVRNGPAHTVAYSTDGQWLASASSTDGTIQLRDASTGREVATWKGHDSGVGALAFSPDGHKLASGGYDSKVKTWDVATRSPIQTLTDHRSSVNRVAFQADGRKLSAIAVDSLVKTWDVETGQLVDARFGLTGFAASIAIRPDGQRAIFGARDGSIKVVDTGSNQPQATIKGPAGMVSCSTFRGDGRMVALGTIDGSIRICDPETGEDRPLLLGHRGKVHGVAFSPDGQRLVSGGADGLVVVWDLKNASALAIRRGHAGEVRAVAFEADGQRVASVGLDSTLRIWDTGPNREVVALRGHKGSVAVVRFLDDRRLASGGLDGTIRIWDVSDGRELKSFQGSVNSVFGLTYQTDPSRFAVSGRGLGVLILDAEDGRELRVLKGHDNRPINAVDFRRDGRRLVSCGFDGTLTLWDPADGREVARWKADNGHVADVAFSPDGRWIASGGEDGATKLWDADDVAKTTTSTLPGNAKYVHAIDYRPDGRRLASAGQDGMVHVWDVETAREVLTLKGHSGSVQAVTFSPDGRRIVSGGQDHRIRIWDAEGGRQLLVLTGHNDAVNGLEFSPDGRRLASAGQDGVVGVWDGRPPENR